MERNVAGQGGAFTLRTLILPAICLAIFLCEFFVFKYSPIIGLDVVILAALTLLPGVLALRSIDHRFHLGLSSHEKIAVGSAVGFGIPAILLAGFHAVGVTHATLQLYLIIALLVLILAFENRKYAFNKALTSRAFDHLVLCCFFVLLFVAAYNLRAFHYLSDGSIVTRGLFGVDIPFLAGEIHGIRDYGSLRDLHQFAQPWHYHEATYQLLALLPRANTLPDLSFVSPLFGYTLLAFAFFTLILRATASEFIATASIAALFLIGSFTGTEQGSYALSPSFVYGTLIFFAAIMVLDKFFTIGNRPAPRYVWLGLFFYLILILSQTKLSTYLTFVGGIVGLWMVMLVTKRKLEWQIPIITLVSFAIVVAQSMAPNPMMPGGDFLIGAPLLGYANHLAVMMHLSPSAINPVTHGVSFRLQSLFIIPYFVFHFLRFALLDPRILIVGILLIVLRKAFRKNDSIVLSSTTIDLLLLLIPIGFLLPVLYSPAWYPLALSFYAPLVSVQAALILTVVGISILRTTPLLPKRNVLVGIVVVALLIGLVQNTRYLSSETAARQDTVHAPLIAAMNGIAASSPDTSLLITRLFDFDQRDTINDESYYWYAALSGHPVLSEGAKYGSLLAAEADIDSAKGLHRVPEAVALLNERRSLIERIYAGDSVVHNRTLLRGALILVDSGTPRMASQPVYSRGGISVWQLR